MTAVTVNTEVQTRAAPQWGGEGGNRRTPNEERTTSMHTSTYQRYCKVIKFFLLVFLFFFFFARYFSKSTRHNVPNFKKMSHRRHRSLTTTPQMERNAEADRRETFLNSTEENWKTIFFGLLLASHPKYS